MLKIGRTLKSTYVQLRDFLSPRAAREDALPYCSAPLHPSRPPLRLYYFYEDRNFGDILNMDIARLMGQDVQYAKAGVADAVFIGSLLTAFIKGKQYLHTRPLKVWGTGFIRPERLLQEKLRRPLDVHALRGQISLERLRKITGEQYGNVAIGDPGLLASRLVDASNIKKQYKLGIIPHYVDKNNPLLNKITVNSACVLDIQQDPLDFLSSVAECENIVSSSLHGLIAADSLGIPNMRMILSEKIVGGDYKFDDYYSAFGISSHTRIDLRKTKEFRETESIGDGYAIRPEMVAKICNDLIAAFPYRQQETVGIGNTV